jgi:DUF4097 and DUF4098 domain-containing protein YvlB
MATRSARRWSGTTLLAVGLAAASGCGLPFMLNAEAREQWKKTYTLAQGGSFEVHNTNGRIEIRVADGDTVDVVADKVVRAGSDEDARNGLKRLDITEAVSSDRVRLDVDTHSFGIHMNQSQHVDFVVKLPRWAAVTLVSTNGDIDVANIGGKFSVDTTNGRVQAEGLTNTARVESTNGAITLDFAKLGDGGVTCETTNGKIEVIIPRDSKAQLSARVTNGAISTSDLNLSTTEQSRRRVEGAIGGGGPAIKLETTNGLITVRGR